MGVSTESRASTKQPPHHQTRAAPRKEVTSHPQIGESRAAVARGLFDELALLRRAGSLLKGDPGEARRFLSLYDERYPEGALREDYNVLMIRLG
jgi:hypothetical protein